MGQTALQSCRLGQLAENKRVLLITGGDGGVGSIAIQIAKVVVKVNGYLASAAAASVLRDDIGYRHEPWEQPRAPKDEKDAATWSR